MELFGELFFLFLLIYLLEFNCGVIRGFGVFYFMIVGVIGDF